MLFWKVRIIEDYASFLVDFCKNDNHSPFSVYPEYFAQPLFLRLRVVNFTTLGLKNSSFRSGK